MCTKANFWAISKLCRPHLLVKKNRYPRGTCVGYLICINGHESMTIVWDITGMPHISHTKTSHFSAEGATLMNSQQSFEPHPDPQETIFST